MTHFHTFELPPALGTPTTPGGEVTTQLPLDTIFFTSREHATLVADANHMLGQSATKHIITEKFNGIH